tara:strand:- start:13495 stop:16014 length:2520 start_codon:yes stop_codon:yes gene_type:complete
MSIISIIEQQVPSYIRNDTNDVFSRFLTEYYKFLSSVDTITLDDISDMSIGLLQKENAFTIRPEKGGVYRQLSSLRSFRDIETTPTSMVSNFVSEYMDGLNAVSLESIRNNISLMKSFYESKGNEKSFHFLFKLLYDAVVEVSYPYEKTLKVSENTWSRFSFIRIETDLVSEELIQNTVGSSIIGNDGSTGFLDSYEVHKIYSEIDSQEKIYYKLFLRDFVAGSGQPTTVTGIGSQTLTILHGLGKLNLDDTVTGIFPSDKIEIEDLTGGIGVQFGASLKIDKMKDMDFSSASIGGNALNQNGYLRIVNDYFTTYEMDYSSQGYSLTGLKSGATATIRNIDAKNRFWVDNISGTFITDYEIDKIGGSEVVEIYNFGGQKVGTTRLGRMYSACDSSASVKIENNNFTVLNKGKNYRFNPYGYIESNGVIHVATITGLGKIEKVDIKEMGYDYTLNSSYSIKVDNTQIGLGVSETVGTEEYYKSILNTLDSEARLRDSNYYQEFSYEIFSKISMSTWKHPVKKLVHPAGMVVHGKEGHVSSPFDLSLADPKQYLSVSIPIENLTFIIFQAMSVETDFTWQVDDGVGVAGVLPQISFLSIPTISLGVGNATSSVPLYNDLGSKLHFNDYSYVLGESFDENVNSIASGTVHTENTLNENAGLLSTTSASYINNSEIHNFVDLTSNNIFSVSHANNKSNTNYSISRVDITDNFQYESISSDSWENGLGKNHLFDDSSTTSIDGTGAETGVGGGRKNQIGDSLGGEIGGSGSSGGSKGTNVVSGSDEYNLDGDGTGDTGAGSGITVFNQETIFDPSVGEDNSPPIKVRKGRTYTYNYNLSPSEMV